MSRVWKVQAAEQGAEMRPQPRPQAVQHGQQLPVLHTVKQGHSPQCS